MSSIRAIIRIAIALTCTLMAFSLFGQQPAKKTSGVSKDDLLDEVARQLMVLPMHLSHYKVKDVSPVEALNVLWETALHERPLIAFHLEKDQANDPEPKITLELSDVPAREILDYIAELSGRRWLLSGSRGYMLSLNLVEFDKIDYGEWDFGADGFVLNEKGAALLGLKTGMKRLEVMAALQRFGVKFDAERDAMAAYDAKHQGLVIAANIEEVRFVSALVRLANAGIKMEVLAQ